LKITSSERMHCVHMHGHVATKIAGLR